MKHRCPVCNKILTESAEESPGHGGILPFCSERCKLIDLGAWLNADYRIASRPNSDESTEPADADNPSFETQ
jgi:hypothetical protein